jgi:hypothetical protein
MFAHCALILFTHYQELQPIRGVDLTSLSTQEMMTIAHLKLPQIQSFKQYSRITVIYDAKDASFFVCAISGLLFSSFLNRLFIV